MRARLLLRGTGKFLAVAAVAVALGAVIGIGLSELSGDDVASTPTIGPTSPAQQTKTQGTAIFGSDKYPIRVTSASLLSATSPSGRARKRARLVARVKVTNRGTKPLRWPRPKLISGKDRVPVDPNANGPAGALLKPLAPGATAAGELRFETAGNVTQRLSDTRRARVRIANQTIEMRVTILKQ
jgi:hypothetical protein